MTIVEILERNAELFSEKTAILFGERRISYNTLYERTNALANFLLQNGLNKGERVGLLVLKCPEAIISFLGVAAAGGIVFPIDYNQTHANIQFILDLTRPSFIIVDSTFCQLLSHLRLPCSKEKIITIGKEEDCYRPWDTILAQEPITPPGITILDNDPVYLNFTSGTTGVPKGAVTTHANIYWNTRASIESFHLTSEDIHLCMFPIFTHPHELFARPLSLGGTIVLTDNIYPKSIAKIISNHRVTCLMAISALYEALMRLYGYAPFDLSSLRIAESGGMHTNPTLVQKFKESFGIPISPVWGSTETTGISIATPIDRGYKAGSMGTSCPHYEVKIVGEDGEELPPDEIGEMVIRGPAVCSEYFNQPDETKRCMKDGWYFTGDLVKMDSDGYFFFMSRKAGMMKVGGMKVFPIEIEDVLMSHPQIAEAAVFKVQDQTHGEVPKALIVIKEGMELSTAEVRRYCEERLAKYKIPRIIEFTPQLPRNPGGKILYRELA